MQFLYKFVYHPNINPILLRINRLLSFLTKFQLPPSGIIKVVAEKGLIFKMATNQTSYVTKLLYWKGSNSFEYTPIFKDLIAHCNCFIDIGANTGYYSLMASTINSKSKTYSFEPAQGPLHYLSRNVLLNKFEKQISIQSTALSNQSGEVLFYEVRNKKYSYLLYNLGGVGSLKEDTAKLAYVVKTKTLDQFVKEQSLLNLDLIKIDTEGTENLILAGASESIEKFKPIIICETLYKKIEGELETIMKRHGYLLYNCVDGRLKKVDSLTRSQDNGVRDCFFVYPTKVHLIEKFIDA